MALRIWCAKRAKLGRGFAWYGLRFADRVNRVLGSHGVNQIFVHMRTNLLEYRDEMNQGSISKYGTAVSKYGTAYGDGLLSKLFA